MEKALLQVVMAEEGKWATFEEDEEALSLSDLPVIDPDKDSTPGDGTRPQEAEEFEFLQKTGETDMCTADEVFFQGQILPLRPSVSSDSGVLQVNRSLSRCESRSESRSFSGRSISRSPSSQSSSSCSSACEAPRRSISNKFYAHPSPKPHICSTWKQNSARKSTSSAGLFRLGLVKMPEIELQDLRLRRANRGKIEMKGREKNTDESSRDVSYKPQKKKGLRFLARGFHCRCSPDDAVDSISSKQGRKKDELGLEGEEVLCHSRTHKWLDELSIAKHMLLDSNGGGGEGGQMD